MVLKKLGGWVAFMLYFVKKGFWIMYVISDFVMKSLRWGIDELEWVVFFSHLDSMLSRAFGEWGECI